MGFRKKTPFVIVEAMLLLFLIFLSTAETGAFARTMKPPTSGVNTTVRWDRRVRRRGGEQMGFAKDSEDGSWRCEGEGNRGGKDDRGTEDAYVKRRGAKMLRDEGLIWSYKFQR
ncbi:hypothetical protein SADUNF_Sadunf08G0012600 [Salix dunnii]|uniref:Glycine-rich protein n=1 Tax=Salix dunnii TaxID=1413687 RepID=A0A835JZ11_9ROSI|nr:hypothetical protein SADUNF_Sadunf08G0012600 [Salix dunnii]